VRRRAGRRFQLCAVCVCLAACSNHVPRAARAAAPALPQPTVSGRTPEASVELLSEQVQAIAIAPVGTSVFVTEREAVGAIGFDEDLTVVQAEAVLLGAAASYELTTKELARAKGLTQAHGGISQRELEQAISDQENAVGALAAARDAVRALGKTDADLDRIIASRVIDSAAGAQSHPSPLVKWAIANVIEVDVPWFRIGQSVRVSVPAYPDRTFDGTVSRIDAVLDPETHRGKLRVRVLDPDNALRPGMLATFVIRVGPSRKAIAVPMSTVVREGDGSMTAWLTTDRHHFLQRIVRLGLAEDGRYEVLDGLRVGDLVVTEGGVFLSDMLHAMVPE